MADDPNEPATEGNEKDEFGLDPKRMTFLEHLLELRGRIFIVMATVVLATILFFVVLRHTLWDWLTYPVMAACAATKGRVPYEKLLVALNPTSFFMASVYYCVFAAVAVTIPVTIWQLWAFVAPGLKRKERRLIGPAIVVTMVLFLAGAAFAYYVLIPIMLVFFLEDTLAFNVTPLWGIADTVKLEALMMLILGVTFELPMVIVLLSKIGIVSPRFLAKYRRHAILVIFLVSAILTPTGDPVTLTLMAVPLIVLYEVGILAARFARPKRAKWDVAEESASPPSEPPEPPAAQPEVPSTPPDQAPPQDYSTESEAYHEGSGYQPEGEAPEAEQPSAPEGAEPAPAPEEPPKEEPKPEPPPPPEEELPPDAVMH